MDGLGEENYVRISEKIRELRAENAALKAELAAAQKDAFRAGMLAAAEEAHKPNEYGFHRTCEEIYEAIRGGSEEMSDMFPSGWWIPTAIGIGLFLAAFGGFFLAVGYWIWG